MTPSTAFVLFLPVLVLVVAGPMLFGGWRIAYAVDHLEPFTNKWCKATYNETRLKNEFHSTEYRNRPIDCVVRGESPSS